MENSGALCLVDEIQAQGQSFHAPKIITGLLKPFLLSLLMASSQPTFVCAMLLILIACNGTLFTEGRKLNSKGFEEPVEAYKDDFRPTTPGSSPGVGHSQTLGSDESVAEYEDDFRPTTPGSSPGVGHSFETKKDDVQSDTQSKGTGVSHSMGGNENDFRPTGPGHSPGVGHAFKPQT
ncbi:hypothetical protein RHSIM_Rhsim08G0102000 [Rhododendron simsii]|uniref:Precursor of CEP9 n=1 Tax=Rhododendron simsii TaxID=118357 RepID=A0A834GPU0_RHOSS|nr:hypothetical protein RHSIM_Rhsim08G0102000 [Rhododendron simsii]